MTFWIAASAPGEPSVPTTIAFMARSLRGLRELRPDHGQHLQALGVLAARARREEDEALGLILGGQDLAVERDQADLGMRDPLVRVRALGDLVALPQQRELRAAGEQR